MVATVLGVVADLVVRVVALVDRVDPAAAHSARWVPHRERLVVPERWRAYVSGDRVALETAGLNYDALLALGDVVSIGTKIVEAAFETRADSTIEDAENREIVADIVTWILDHPEAQQPTPRKSSVSPSKRSSRIRC